jgi:hypothetical protein
MRGKIFESNVILYERKIVMDMVVNFAGFEFEDGERI